MLLILLLLLVLHLHVLTNFALLGDHVPHMTEVQGKVSLFLLHLLDIVVGSHSVTTLGLL